MAFSLPPRLRDETELEHRIEIATYDLDSCFQFVCDNDKQGWVVKGENMEGKGWNAFDQKDQAKRRERRFAIILIDCPSSLQLFVKFYR